MMTPTRTRIGALALATSAALLMLFPLARPFFPLDVFEPARTLGAGGTALASTSWFIAHLMGMVGFALLPFGLLALYAQLAEGAAEPRAARGLVASLAGVSLVLPAFGVETFAMPLLARTYLAGTTAVAPMLASTYRGPMTLVMLIGLALLAIGAFDFARAIRRGRTLPGRAAVVFALGLALWLPLLPRIVRIVDGLLIGVGGLWLAWAMWRSAKASVDAVRPEPAYATVTRRGTRADETTTPRSRSGASEAERGSPRMPGVILRDRRPVHEAAAHPPGRAGINAASVLGRIALGRRDGARVWRLGGRADVPWVASQGPRQAHVEGFDLHANVAVPGSDRRRLEQVCRYLLRFFPSGPMEPDQS